MDITEGLVERPQDLSEKYKEAGLWNGKTLGRYLTESAERFREKVAVVDGTTRISFGELDQLASGLAVNLLESGLKRGDTVVVQLPNCWEFVVLFYGLARIGVVPILALPGHREHEISYFVEHAQASAIFVPDELRGFDHQSMAHHLANQFPCIESVFVTGNSLYPNSINLRSLISIPDDPERSRELLYDSEPDSTDVALFLLSGGTTGLPKLIPRSHDDYSYNFRTAVEVCGFDSESVYAVVLPASHNFPLACPGLLGTLSVGGRVVMAKSPEPDAALSLIETEKVTVTAVVPAVAQRWLDKISSGSSPDISSLRLLQVGGARMAPELARRVKPLLQCTLQQVFGMAEGLVNFTGLDDTEDVICETQGRPMSPYDEISIVDENGEEVANGEMGELLTHGPYTLRGYYRAEDHNLRSFSKEGWYRTGDVVQLDEQGNIIVMGRTKDLINRGGEKISAEEIENLIYRISNVSQVAAVAVPDPELGERTCVVVVLKDQAIGLSLEEIHEALNRFGVARYKYPERVEIVDSLPFTNVGKIDKNRLRRDLDPIS